MNGEVAAAGSFSTSKVLVIGADVAGLAAISTASNMGAIVGGEFLLLDFAEDECDEGTWYAKVISDAFIQKDMELFREQAKEWQNIITTAAIPGRPAPKLIWKDVVDNMSSGSVIINLAGATGDNCKLT